MKKKLLSVILSTAMIASVLSGCGGNDGGSASTPATDDAAPAEDTAPADDAAPAEDAAPADDAADSAASGDKFYIYSWNTELQERLAFVFEANPGMEDRIEYVNIGDSGIYQERIDQ